MERETGIEPATNSLEGCDSTTELLPPPRLASYRFPGRLRRATPPFTTLNLAHEPKLALSLAALLTNLPTEARGLPPGASEGWWGGEGSNLRSPLGGRFTVCCD